MLKKIILNRRTIPVPVPIQNLDEALAWVDQTLLKSDEMITKIVVDDRKVSDEGLSEKQVKEFRLNGASKLEIQVDSPLELSTQSLEAIRNLADVVEKSLKPLAVDCWQTVPVNTPKGLKAIQDDICLIMELTDHFLELIHEGIDVSIFKYLVDKVESVIVALNSANENRDWQEYARILLNHLEPALQNLIDESANLQGAIFSKLSEQNMTRG